MRIYLIATGSDLGIKVSNIINGSGSNCIISGLKADDYEQQLRDLADNAKRYEMCIVASTRPALVAIEANKLSGVRAVACKNSDDVLEAVNASANVLVFTPNVLGRSTPDLIGAVVGAQPTQKRLMPSFESKAQRAPTPARLQPERRSQRRVAEEQGDNAPIWDKNKGVVKNLKSLFGVD